MQKLEDWLTSIGQPYERSGDDVCMPSPFKERDKKKRGEPSTYVDANYRLSVTIEEFEGSPTLLWQCWYTKKPDGNPYGGRTGFALSVRTGVPCGTIHKILDLEFDEVVHRAENLEDKVQAILSQDTRKETRRIEARKKEAQEGPLGLWAPPGDIIPLFRGLPFTEVGEAIVMQRGITPETALAYGVSWMPDWGDGKLWFPWWTQDGRYAYHQWYDPDQRRYFFPKRQEGLVTKYDLIYGLWCWNESRPVVICEGIFDTLTLCGQCIAGSALSKEQTALLVALRPQMIIIALDKDGAGINGAKAMEALIKQHLPNSEVVVVFPPHGDWNDIAKERGQTAALAEFRERVQAARGQSGISPLEARVRQLLG